KLLTFSRQGNVLHYKLGFNIGQVLKMVVGEG
ncbi:hypothetical protein J2X14_001021, partial [Pantoea alhagi]|nr:hypothetical protein [Pantoea alhagi]